MIQSPTTKRLILAVDHGRTIASAVLADIPAVDIAKIALVLLRLRGRIGGKSVGA
jgi:hypothetical protein